MTNYSASGLTDHKPHSTGLAGCTRCNDEEDHEMQCELNRDGARLECGYVCPFTNAENNINAVYARQRGSS
ncbi:hypothetical protein MHLP_01070 [Candidatus Mycoplasma haematolamae str. Purdue]|uniref:Uncharacterized protein n=1 Tax=Mycoplasma haematolamae (strain Purdue) TaxID=1212765 RepID=I7CIU4_MYCHA|nr:hypothetical protein [Candidatus Mycoplasma haematolamae]AFO51794.1 hypothetical protein MHLP_01070 [Candidatus Mycoplasma haematolamae str. Purdue]